MRRLFESQLKLTVSYKPKMPYRTRAFLPPAVVQFVTQWHIITENSENDANLVWSTVSIASKNQCCCDTLQFFHVYRTPGSKVFSSICYSLNAILSLDKFHKFLKPQ